MIKDNTTSELPLSESSELTLTKDLRKQSEKALKLDLAYIAATGAVITAMQISNFDLIVNIFFVRLFAGGLAALIFIDAWTYMQLNIEVARLMLYAPQKWEWLQSMVRKTALYQPIFHLIFWGSLLSYFTGYLSGQVEETQEYEAKVILQKEIKFYQSERGTLPKELYLLRPSKQYEKALLLLEDMPLKYTTGPNISFTLAFAGRDHIFGTEDDTVIDEKTIDLKEIYNSLNKLHSKPLLQK